MNKVIERSSVNFRKDIYKLYSFSAFESFFLFLRSFLLDYVDLTKHIPLSSSILDIGCGYGVLANYLAFSDSSSSVKGVDIDGLRVKKARDSIGQRKNISFDQIDFMSMDLAVFSVILMIDVMHYFNYGQQDKVIESIASQLKAGGMFIFRTPDTKPKWRYYWNYLHESLMVGSNFTKTDNSSLYFRSSESFISTLRSAGFEVVAYPNMSIFPYSDTLYVCKKLVSTY